MGPTQLEHAILQAEHEAPFWKLLSGQTDSHQPAEFRANPYLQEVQMLSAVQVVHCLGQKEQNLTICDSAGKVLLGHCEAGAQV